MAEVKGFIEVGESTSETQPIIAQHKASLEEQLDNFRKLDAEILSSLVEQEGITDDKIAEEVKTAGTLKGEIKAITAASAELLTPKPESSASPQQNTSVASGNVATNSNVRVKLPKLEVQCFDGKVEEWQEFWDCYESPIHLNQNLSSIDKFSYLHGLLGGAARTTIAGLALKTANYGVAIDLLRGGFGKPTVIK